MDFLIAARRLFPALCVALLALAWSPAPAAAQDGFCADARTGVDCRAASRKPPFSTPTPRPDSILSGVTYGWIEDYAYFYERPEPGAPHAQTAMSGFFYGPAHDATVDEQGREWFQVWDYWLPARYFHPVEASDFAGVEVNAPPQRPFGWVVRPVVPGPGPAEEANATTPELPRYHFVQVHESRSVGGVLWYNIGRNRWVRYNTVALITQQRRPLGVAHEEYWVDVDLVAQTFTAYEGDRMVYAGLVSSGLPRWQTRIGLNRVWERHETTPMSGGEVGDDYYYIDAVPHTLYFDGETALHGAFWHDDFGRPKSHGCVNMAPRTAEWVFEWSKDAPGGLWVRVRYG